ncbi:MAG: DUF3616 domain-containing protein [Polyangiaceae bacterium]
MSDEDNVLRVYDADHPGAPLRTQDVSRELGLLKSKKNEPDAVRMEEGDFEAATLLGDKAYFLTSHGRNSSGKLKPARFRFFATTTPRDGALALVGEGYQSLLDDLLKDARLGPFGLRAAAERAPKAAGGLNLEGMTERQEGGVWLGFRNPIPNGKALLLPLNNPAELLEGKPAVFGEPRLLDLGGLGVRGLSWFRGRYLIAAGHFDHGATSRLFTWDGVGAPREVPGLDLRDFNPEAFFTPESRDRVLLLSDDGSRLVNGTECKRVAPEQRAFRGMWVSLPKSAP